MTRQVIDLLYICWHSVVMVILLAVISIAFFVAMLLLRYSKGILPLRRNESAIMPGVPGVAGIIYRLDGMEHKNRSITFARYATVQIDGAIVLPHRWKNADATAGRMAAAAYLWAHSQMAEEDEEGMRTYKTAIFRAMVVPLAACFIMLALIFFKEIDWRMAFSLVCATWALLAFMALPSQYRNWKARDLARRALQERGLMPNNKKDAMAVEQCLNAMIWCNVAGFRPISPK